MPHLRRYRMFAGVAQHGFQDVGWVKCVAALAAICCLTNWLFPVGAHRTTARHMDRYAHGAAKRHERADAGEPTRFAEEQAPAHSRHAVGEQFWLPADLRDSLLADANHRGPLDHDPTAHRRVGMASRRAHGRAGF